MHAVTRKSPLVHAGGSWSHVDAIEITVSYEGFIGRGSSSIPFHETSDDARTFLDALAREKVPNPFDRLEWSQLIERLPRSNAARASLNSALFDLSGIILNTPLYRLLGVPLPTIPTCGTVSLASPFVMTQEARAKATRFKRLKVKLGAGDELDVARLEAIRGTTDCPIMVDVNGGWTYEEASRRLPQLRRLNFELVEQPLKARSADQERLWRSTPLPLFLDEDCIDIDDIATCSRKSNGVNVKLSKCGGIDQVIEMCRTAKMLGLKVMIGCGIESNLAIAAAAHISGIADYVDLDGNLSTEADDIAGVQFVDGVQMPLDLPGIGSQRYRDLPSSNQNTDE